MNEGTWENEKKNRKLKRGNKEWDVLSKQAIEWL